jgi:Flp pilus assembly protein TadD
MTSVTRRWLFLAACCLTALAYSNSFSVPFIFDDRDTIIANYALRSLWPGLGLFGTSPDMTSYGRPLIEFSLAINYAISGLEPWSYHVVNLFAHLACGIFVWRLVAELLIAGRLSAERAENLALVTVSLWLVHPIQTAAVTYTVQRAEIFVSLCYAATMLFALRSARLPKRHGGTGNAMLACLFCALGMLCKESMATAPLAVVLLDVLLFRFRGDDLRRRLPVHAGLALSWILLAVLMWRFPRGRSVGFYENGPGAMDYLLMQGGVILHYIRLVLLPFGFCLDHDWPVPAGFIAALPAVLTVALMGGIALWFSLRGNVFGCAGVLIFLILAPTSSVIPVMTSTAAEHRMYLPSAFLILLVVGACGAVLGSVRSSIKLATVMGFAAFLAALTFQRNTTFGSAPAIWSEVVERYPASRRAWNNLGTSLLLEEREDEALAAFLKALALKPDFGPGLANISGILERKGRMAEAERFAARAAEIIGENPSVQIRHARLLLSLGRSAEAAQALDRALKLAPTQPVANAMKARLCLAAGDILGAKEFAGRTLGVVPNDAEALAILRECDAKEKGAPDGSLR